MKMVRKCYLIFTPYQLITCLNITKIKSEDKNLFIFLDPSIEKYVGLCNDFGVDVEILKDFYGKVKGNSLFIKHLYLAFRVFKISYIIKFLTINVEDIDELFVPSDDVVCRAMLKIIKKSNHNIILSLYDDGIGTYGGNMFRVKNRIGQLFYDIFLERNYCEKITRLYCYRKNLVKNFPDNVNIIEIKNERKITDLLCKISSDLTGKYKGVRILFLDQGLDYDKIYECLSILNNKFGNSFAIKIHPRIKSGKYEGFRIIDDGLPIEAIVSTFLDSKCMLISHCSTGCISSYIMGGETSPSVVFLSSIINNDSWSESATAVVKNIVKEMDVKCIFFPRSVNEFEILLDLYKEDN